MATSQKSSEPRRLAIGSYQTALCLIPPAHTCQSIDRLRELYDTAYGKWPAHVNLIYPFVSIESLPAAVELVRSRLVKLGPESGHRNIHLRLEKSDHFSHRHGDTIYIAPGDGAGSQSLNHLRRAMLEDFEQNDETHRPHLTIGQSQAQDASMRAYLLAKASLLLPLEWHVEELAVLIRERPHGQDNGSSQMTIWGTISLSGATAIKAGRFRDYQEKPQKEEEWSDEEERQAVGRRSTATYPLVQSLHMETNDAGARRISTTQPGVTYQFSTTAAMWEPVPGIKISAAQPGEAQLPRALTISSYNVLVDSLYPPVRDRCTLLLEALLSESALADILVLQEVSDDFLSHILRDDAVRSRYPFTTHGPPDQLGVGPLASLRNIVVLSHWSFCWEWVPFERRHKGAVVLKVHTIAKGKDSVSLPLIVAGVHLTCGLTDGAVAAKKSQLQALVNHLSREHPQNPWIVAGDFNITTSAFSIDTALKKKSISPQTGSTLASIETTLSEARLSDSWFVARTEGRETLMAIQGQKESEDLYEGEQGATFDPAENPLAAEAGGRGSNNRPQRYDRILVKGEDFLRVTAFNMFGFPEESGSEAIDGRTEDQDEEPRCGSDHWGIRATLRIDPSSGERGLEDSDVQLVPLQLRKAPQNLSDIAALKSCLAELSMFPPDEEINKRRETFALVKSILQESPVQQYGDTANKRSIISMAVVPVGSYGLGVWSTSSDIDCLCIGSMSAKTFFALATHRLRKAADLGVRILRKVKATSGTMLELDVRGTKFDLQYCPAARIAERWPEAIRLPPSDPLFDLPLLSLTKLKSLRDLDYLQRTIPDLATFRIAYRFITAWAKQRGIYSSKFGYLGGFHIALMLSRICKLLFRGAGAVTASDIICTFFNYYANFDWKNDMAFDPFFYNQQPRYHRSVREPMVILGFHAPTVNVAHTASLPSLSTMVGELKRANCLLSEAGTTWSKVIGGAEKEEAIPALPYGAHEFLSAYNSYIAINVQYWGLSLAKGSTLVGWLESRCVLLLVDINRKLPHIYARIWPARFTMNHADGESQRDYQGCYLVGLARTEDVGARAWTESDHKQAQGALRMVLERFADQIRSDEKHFDAKSSWVDVAHVKQAELRDLKLDDREWGNHVVQEDESDNEEEVEEAALEMDNEDDEAAAAAASTKPKSSSAGKGTSNPASIQKLRPAADILNRLRWDPNLDSSDYIVGYEDRFLGTREMALDRWKTEQTDEEFIPQHRVMYFKRKSDGVVVWERETRRDEIFGSGAGRR